MDKKAGFIFSLAAGLGLCSCQQGILSSASADASASRDYPDTVTRLSQVDPYYRAAFRGQQGANFSLADQRKAFLAACATARTPVPKAVPQRAVAKSSKKRSSSRRVASRRRR